jgi:hypothetical protein
MWTVFEGGESFGQEFFGMG